MYLHDFVPSYESHITVYTSFLKLHTEYIYISEAVNRYPSIAYHTSILAQCWREAEALGRKIPKVNVSKLNKLNAGFFHVCTCAFVQCRRHGIVST